MLAKNTLDVNDIKNHTEYYTVGQLKKFLEKYNIPDHAKICIQRVENIYFEQYDWSTIKKEGFQYREFEKYIEKAKPGGEFHDKDKYPNLTDHDINKILESSSNLRDLVDEYVPIWSPVKYDDDYNLYLDAHY